MAIATVMVYVDPAQQAEGQVRVARSIAAKFDASLIGVSAFAVEPNFVAEGVIIEETTPEDLKRMKTALAEKQGCFGKSWRFQRKGWNGDGMSNFQPRSW